MSTRYVWDKYNVIYGNKQTVEKTKYSIDLDGPDYDGAFYFSTGIKTAADGSYTLTGTVLNAISASHTETYVYASASTYRYGAKYKTGNTSYIENTEASSAYWCFQVSHYGNYTYKGEAVLRQDASSFASQYAFSAYELSKTKGPTKIGTVSSANSDAYPQDGVSGSNWYVYKGSDSIDPLSVTYSTNEPDRGETVTAIVEPQATQGVTISYLYQYSTDGGQTWTSAGNATTDTQKGITVPSNAEQFMVRVRAQDDIGFTSADYVTGANLEVQIMRLWVGVDNAAHKGTKLWVGVDGAARRVVRAWVGDENGKARRWF